MLRRVLLVLAFSAPLAAAGCGGIETVIFPTFADEFRIAPPPAPLGPFAFSERRVEFADLGDGEPGGVTVFEPVGAEGPRPALVWVLGVNNRAHYHQSFHEYMASWGWVDVIVDTRDIQFSDTQYHERNTDNATRTVDRALAGELGVLVDSKRLALGGYSVGGTLAAFAAGRSPQVGALAMWAPSPALVWQGVDPDAELARVTQPSLFLLAERDIVVGDWPEQMQATMTASTPTIEVIPLGVHLYFQQPSLVDDRNPETPITRVEQMRTAIEATRAYLEARLPPTAAGG